MERPHLFSSLNEELAELTHGGVVVDGTVVAAELGGR